MDFMDFMDFMDRMMRYRGYNRGHNGRGERTRNMQIVLACSRCGGLAIDKRHTVS
jgi:hypothetical protein